MWRPGEDCQAVATARALRQDVDNLHGDAWGVVGMLGERRLLGRGHGQSRGDPAGLACSISGATGRSDSWLRILGRDSGRPAQRHTADAVLADRLGDKEQKVVAAFRGPRHPGCRGRSGVRQAPVDTRRRFWNTTGRRWWSSTDRFGRTRIPRTGRRSIWSAVSSACSDHTFAQVRRRRNCVVLMPTTAACASAFSSMMSTIALTVTSTLRRRPWALATRRDYAREQRR